MGRAVSSSVVVRSDLPAIFRRRDGTTEALLENGLVMGFDEAAPFTSIERQAGPGDRLLLFTDGVIEATGPSDEPFGPGATRQDDA